MDRLLKLYQGLIVIHVRVRVTVWWIDYWNNCIFTNSWGGVTGSSDRLMDRLLKPSVKSIVVAGQVRVTVWWIDYWNTKSVSFDSTTPLFEWPFDGSTTETKLNILESMKVWSEWPFDGSTSSFGGLIPFAIQAFLRSLSSNGNQTVPLKPLLKAKKRFQGIFTYQKMSINSVKCNCKIAPRSAFPPRGKWPLDESTSRKSQDFREVYYKISHLISQNTPLTKFFTFSHTTCLIIAL